MLEEKEFLKKILEEKLSDIGSQIEDIMALSSESIDEEENNLWKQILEKKKKQIEELEKAKQWIEELKNDE